MLLSRFKIVGHSMEPTFNPGDVVLISSFPYILRNPMVGDLIVLKREKYIIKRIEKIKENKFFVVGDNKKESTDSRKFGWVSRNEIVGKIILKI